MGKSYTKYYKLTKLYEMTIKSEGSVSPGKAMVMIFTAGHHLKLWLRLLKRSIRQVC